ncbi:MAG TPA: nucleotide exchange factor GrpE [Terriglobia bacterium]|nr:nucleotide exchange factor GrpE [Terriglobia bacterium]
MSEQDTRNEPAAAAAGSNGQAAVETAPSESANLPEDLAGAYRRLLAEKQDLYDRLLRKQAELDNFRKRTEREKEEFSKHATADLIRSLLPALDSFERALKHRDPKIPQEYYKGIELIHRDVLDILVRAGLDPLDTKGKLFDPHLHQAVESVESDKHRDQEIVEELQRGYKLRHRLLRPAVVKVAVAPKSATDGQAEGHAKKSRASEGAEQG